MSSNELKSNAELLTSLGRRLQAQTPQPIAASIATDCTTSTASASAVTAKQGGYLQRIIEQNKHKRAASIAAPFPIEKVSSSTRTQKKAEEKAEEATEKYTYRDYARRAAPPHPSNYDLFRKGNKGDEDSSNSTTFPERLYDILSCPDVSDIVTWMPHGRSWTILKPKAFESVVLPKLYSTKCKYTSFLRQANGWGFRRITQGHDRNSYYHELFLRGLPHLCKLMRRPGVSKKLPIDLDNEPDFHALSKVSPLPPLPHDTNKDVAVSTLETSPSCATAVPCANTVSPAFQQEKLYGVSLRAASAEEKRRLEVEEMTQSMLINSMKQGSRASLALSNQGLLGHNSVSMQHLLGLSDREQMMNMILSKSVPHENLGSIGMTEGERQVLRAAQAQTSGNLAHHFAKHAVTAASVKPAAWPEMLRGPVAARNFRGLSQFKTDANALSSLRAAPIDLQPLTRNNLCMGQIRAGTEGLPESGTASLGRFNNDSPDGLEQLTKRWP